METKRFIAAGMTCPSIANIYRANKWTIYSIKQGKSWAWLEM